MGNKHQKREKKRKDDKKYWINLKRKHDPNKTIQMQEFGDLYSKVQQNLYQDPYNPTNKHPLKDLIKNKVYFITERNNQRFLNPLLLVLYMTIGNCEPLPIAILDECADGNTFNDAAILSDHEKHDLLMKTYARLECNTMYIVKYMPNNRIFLLRKILKTK